MTITKGDDTTTTQETQDTTYNTFVKSGSTAAAGLVPKPNTTAGTTLYLREDATWVKPPNTTYSTFVKSGSSAAAGLVPKPSTTAGTAKYLREDATWQTPPNTTYSVATTSANGLMSSAMVTKLGSGGITASSFGTNGYVKFANGFIVQWGRFQTSSNQNTKKTFPITFADTNYSITLTVYNPSGSATSSGYDGATGVKYFQKRAENITDHHGLRKYCNRGHWRKVQPAYQHISV